MPKNLVLIIILVSFLMPGCSIGSRSLLPPRSTPSDRVVPSSAPASQTTAQSFTWWCQRQKSAPVVTKRTIDLLLAKAGTENCSGAEARLDSLTKLDLYGSKITDLQPVASLNTLTNLELGDNQIKDLKPLASLSKLAFLGLGSNKISDVQPLASLNNLTGLYLGDNQIKNIQPLASLMNLTELNLDRNQIRDIKPLASLSKLADLRLYSNQISEKICPVRPDSICKF
jgi:Leucine Rich repeats (2 copies)